MSRPRWPFFGPAVKQQTWFGLRFGFLTTTMIKTMAEIGRA